MRRSTPHERVSPHSVVVGVGSESVSEWLIGWLVGRWLIAGVVQTNQIISHHTQSRSVRERYHIPAFGCHAMPVAVGGGGTANPTQLRTCCANN